MMMDTSSSNQKQHLALRVALDTMKDRCILQCKRLTEIEEENQKLRERLTQQPSTSTHKATNAGGVAENFQLRLQLNEMQRQNSQLNALNNMVSAENRKLWSRLSQMAKDQSSKLKDSDCTLTASDVDGVVGANSQNLIRSKTFTQHSPNPNLRHLRPAESCESDMRDVSLEADVALEAFVDGEGISKTNEEAMTQVAMGFGYLNVDDATNSPQEQDFNVEAKRCIEGLQEMRREAMRQQKELNSVFALLESRIALQPCPECVKNSQKPEMADKSLETDESFNDSKYSNKNNQHDLNNFNESSSKAATVSATPSTQQQLQQTNHVDIIQEKLLADESNKICPMCGKLYDCAVTFESFCEHVEEHFRDDTIDIDYSMEHNFELITNAAGDF